MEKENIIKELQKIQWNPKGGDFKHHIWEYSCTGSCKCDGCDKNNEIEELIKSI